MEAYRPPFIITNEILSHFSQSISNHTFIMLSRMETQSKRTAPQDEPGSIQSSGSYGKDYGNQFISVPVTDKILPPSFPPHMPSGLPEGPIPA